MKKFLLPLMAMLVSMVACQKDNEGILKLEVEQYTSDNKLHLDNNNYAVWDNGDHIWLNGYDETVCVEGTTATISVTNPSSYGIYTAIYPYDWAGNNSWTSIIYPETQTYRTNTAGLQVIDAPMVASVTPGSDVLKFKNVGSILAIDVTNSGTTVMNVQKIEVTNSELGKINGEFNINNLTTNPTLSLSTADVGSRTTTLNCGGVIIPAGESKTFYVAMPTVEAKLNIKVYDDNNIYYKVQTSAHTMVANHGYTAPIASTDNPTRYVPLGNQIKYVTSDGNPIVAWNEDSEETCNPVGMNWSSLGLCTSNVYYETLGFGMITFANPITTIGETGVDHTTLFYDNYYYGIYSDSHIKDLYLPEGVTSLGRWAFSNETYTGTISLPSTLTTITNGALNNRVSRLEMHSTIPPERTDNNYQNFYNFDDYNTVLHVPAGYKNDYINSTWGPLFGNGTRIVDDL